VRAGAVVGVGTRGRVGVVVGGKAVAVGAAVAVAAIVAVSGERVGEGVARGADPQATSPSRHRNVSMARRMAYSLTRYYHRDTVCAYDSQPWKFPSVPIGAVLSGQAPGAGIGAALRMGGASITAIMEDAA